MAKAAVASTDVAALTTAGMSREMPRAWKVSIQYFLIVVFFCHDAIFALFPACLFSLPPSNEAAVGALGQ